MDVRQKNAALEQALKDAKESYGQLKDDRENLKVHFANLAGEILEKNREKLDKQSKESLKPILEPLKEQIKSFAKKVEKGSEHRIQLVEQIKHLHALNQELDKDAKNLARALKGDTKNQGNWGELVLERVLEISGLEKGREYETQVSMTTEEGKRYQPDVLVHLPDERKVIIDSKVSLEAYSEFCASTEDDVQTNALSKLVMSLRSHIKGLGDKDYQSLLGDASLNCVLMFVPVEGAFAAAVRADEKIVREALERNIIVVTPSTLLLALRVVENIWRVQRQNQNAEKIATQAGQLYDKMVLVVEALKDVDTRIRQTREAYNTAQKRLSTGTGNVLKRVEDLRKLGARTNKSLPAGAFSEEESPEVIELKDNQAELLESS
jgi:DNA recombination protein RmuC